MNESEWSDVIVIVIVVFIISMLFIFAVLMAVGNQKWYSSDDE